jgi:hypothetical protein
VVIYSRNSLLSCSSDFTYLHQVIGILLTLYPSQLPGEYTAHHYHSADVLITHISVHSPDLYVAILAEITTKWHAEFRSKKCPYKTGVFGREVHII